MPGLLSDWDSSARVVGSQQTPISVGWTRLMPAARRPTCFLLLDRETLTQFPLRAPLVRPSLNEAGGPGDPWGQGSYEGGVTMGVLLRTKTQQ